MSAPHLSPKQAVWFAAESCLDGQPELESELPPDLELDGRDIEIVPLTADARGLL